MISKLFNKEDTMSIPKLIGVAGTSGKTITSHIVYHILKTAGKRVGIITTNGAEYQDTAHHEININTSNRKQVREKLNEMFHKGIKIVVIEVTAKNIKKGIYKGLTFDTEIITNIMGDTEFGTWDSYAKNYLQFINQIKEGGILVLNADENDTRVWLSYNSDRIKQNIYVYWASTNNMYNASFSLAGSRLDIGGIASLQTNLLGHFNAVNIYQAAKTALHYVSIQNVVDGLRTLKSPKGRLDMISNAPYQILIDYGNDPKHIYDALTFLKAAKNQSSRLISVIGAKGDTKNPHYHISSIATELSDTVLITSNDPVREDTKSINQKMINHSFEKGGKLVSSFDSTDQVQRTPIANVINAMNSFASNSFTPLLSFNQNDFKGRLDAIAYAFSLARPGDIVYISGKGHENSIRYKDIEYEWSDYEAARLGLERSR